jgi:predicted RNase H-like nuclease (RuvC/YqgF family)
MTTRGKTMGEAMALYRPGKTEKAKIYLAQYRYARYEERRLLLRICDLRETQASARSPRMTGMPHGSGKTDLSDYVARLDERIQDLQAKGDECRRLYTEIDAAISRLADPAERYVLRERYLQDRPTNITTIAMHLAVSDRTCYRIYQAALQHVAIPDDTAAGD